jgi:hypothetical protein
MPPAPGTSCTTFRDQPLRVFFQINVICRKNGIFFWEFCVLVANNAQKGRHRAPIDPNNKTDETILYGTDAPACVCWGEQAHALLSGERARRVSYLQVRFVFCLPRRRLCDKSVRQTSDASRAGRFSEEQKEEVDKLVSPRRQFVSGCALSSLTYRGGTTDK